MVLKEEQSVKLHAEPGWGWDGVHRGREREAARFKLKISTL